MERSVSQYIAYYWTIVPVFLIMLIFISGRGDINNICLFVLSVMFIGLFNNKSISVNLLDITILLIWIYEVFLLFISINYIASFLYIKYFTITVIYYFILRFFFTKKKIVILLLWESFFFCILSLIGFVSFLLFKERIYLGGFNDLYDFRYIFFPLGNLTNTWANLLLGFLGTICLTIIYANNKQKKILFLAIIPIVFGLIVTFSRGTYLTIIFLLFVFALLLIRSKTINWWKKIGIASLVLIGFFSLSIPHLSEVQRTLQINASVSQQRSIEGRVNEGHVAYNIFQKHQITGVGSGNYSLAANEYLYEKDPSTYTSIVSNIAFQFLSEKGIIGICLWIVVFCVIIYLLYFNKKREIVIIFIFIIAIGIRELTFSVLLNHTGLQLIVITWIAVLQDCLINKKYILNITNSIIRKIIRWLPLLMWVSIFTYDRILLYNNKYNGKCIQAIKSDNIDLAETLINRAHESIPCLINRSSIYCKQYRKTEKNCYLNLAEETLKKAIIKNPKDFQLQHNLAIILILQEKFNDAYTILNQLVNQFPKNPLYHITFSGLLYKTENVEASIKHIILAIKLSPAILDTQLFHEIMSKFKNIDSTVYNILKNDIVTYPKIEKNPILLAQQAKILLYLGDTITAQSYLKKAVKQMPNLSRPWCYLGVIAFDKGDELSGKRYLTHSMVADPMDNISKFYWKKYTEKVAETNIQELNNNIFTKIYYMKFQKWYNTQPVEFDDLLFIMIDKVTK
ncbi:MAG: O-antigen ligase family protein [Bacteroidales bacterium]|jgi:O-antigen ligase/Tfp pilus assembly protein PilF|nr:O-antigen ligase family protein [Bacteroidales bacterium]